jgi:hypothetical protein
MNQRLQLLRCGTCALALVLMVGCLIPYPHTSVRSPEFSGRVVDAETHAPISGAKIWVIGHPQTSCETDATGRFRLKETHNFHVGVVVVPGGGGELPQGIFDMGLAVSHAGYETNYLAVDLARPRNRAAALPHAGHETGYTPIFFESGADISLSPLKQDNGETTPRSQPPKTQKPLDSPKASTTR